MEDKKHLSILVGYSSIGIPVFSPVEFYSTITELVTFLEANGFEYEDIYEIHANPSKEEEYKLTIAQKRRKLKKRWRR
jgi:hypothetical protein